MASPAHVPHQSEPNPWSRPETFSYPPMQELPPAPQLPVQYYDTAPVQPYAYPQTDLSGITSNHTRELAPSPSAPQQVENGPKNRNKLFAGIAIGTIGALSAAALTGYLYMKSKTDELVSMSGAGDRSVSGAQVPGQEGNATHEVITVNEATPDQFFDDNNFTDSERVAWAYEKLNTPSDEQGYGGKTILEVAHAKLAAELNKPGERPYLGELVEPSESMTGDQINTLFSSISYLSATSDLPENDRVKIQAAEIDNSNDVLATIVDYVKKRDTNHLKGTHEVVTNSQTGAKIESPVFKHYVPENGFDPAGIPSKIMNILDTSSGSGEISQNTIQFIDDKPVILDSIPATDSENRVTYPQNIPENS